jgi:23S rRNA pseudouridine2605 synthase
MVFKRPGNSRDDRSGGSANRRKSGDEKPSKTGASRYKKPSGSGFESSGKRPGFKSYGNDANGSGEKSPLSRRKPYSGKPESDDIAANRRSGSSRSWPADKPKRSFGGDRSADKKDHPSRGKTSFSGKSTYEGKQRKSFAGDSNRTSERTSERKPSFRGDKRSEEGGYKPFRKSENSAYNRKPSFKTERNTDEKPLRARKKAAEDNGLIRLNRYISNAGICSRRKADELIIAGVISVNGEVVSELGYKIDPAKDSVRYNGELLKREKMVYVLLNKPKDYITTTDDPQERRTVMQLVEKASRERIYPVGRLDRNTTGLLLMTNDGDLADKLSHPKNNIVKLYHAELNKSLSQGDLNKISFGVELEDGFIKPDAISYVQGASKREIGIQIHSGKNRIVRRIFEHLGYEVVKLDRAVYANLTKKDLPRGRWRYLDEKEVIQLKHLI